MRLSLSLFLFIFFLANIPLVVFASEADQRDVEVNLDALESIPSKKGLRSRASVQLKAPPKAPNFKPSDFKEKMVTSLDMGEVPITDSLDASTHEPLYDYKPPQMFSGRTATGSRKDIHNLYTLPQSSQLHGLRPESPKSRRGGVSSYVVSPLPAIPAKEVAREVLPQAPVVKQPGPQLHLNKDGNVIRYDLVNPTAEDIVRSIEGKKR